MARGTEKTPSRLPREARGTLRKEEILTEAARLFAQHGYSETDTQLLAETDRRRQGDGLPLFSQQARAVSGGRRPRDAHDARACRSQSSKTSPIR